MKLTIIGNGTMALALADGLKEKYELEFFIRDSEKLQHIFRQQGSPIYLLDDVDIENKNLLLCVKPNALEMVAQKLHGKARSLYSIMAGTTIESLRQEIDAQFVIRAMPNLAATYGASATALTGDSEYRSEALEIFEAVGDAIWLNSEKELDIATAVAGSGPAYLAMVAEALMDGAVKQGLKRADSVAFVEALFKGFSPLLSAQHPALLKDAVMSPGGTTAAGYSTLEEGGVRDSFIKAVESAFMVTQKKR